MATSRSERTLKRVLIANRGEIACRVIRACREAGLQTVAVYSDADAGALHVAMADHAVHLGAAPAAESYLSIPRVMEAVRSSGADAVHPGYGFLSENAGFAKACEEAGITFVGPSSTSIEALGNKVRAREMAALADVPTIRGSGEPVRDAADAATVAENVGYPVLLKAAAGGGGKGMRVVHRKEDLAESLARAASEAGAAFKDTSVYIEKYLSSPHHVEIQIFGDQHGNVVYLGERECSIQRRHQKVVEESPSPTLDADLRARMGAAAVRVAKASKYHGAGTVEFLVDGQKNFYFLEVNTRLQVEHPVTEMVTGLDLVKLQLAVAEGKPLPFAQADVAPRGHAVEVRVYAEDPDKNFMPSPGQLVLYRRPEVPWVREDTGVREGATITPHYDPMISKVIAWGATRAEAIARLRGALADFAIAGIKTTVPFLLNVLDHPAFRAGDTTTDFIEKHREALFAPAPVELVDRAAIAAALARAMADGALAGDDLAPPDSNWRQFGRRQAMSSAYRYRD
jgi:acetyl-CoA carboxylase biotin carboxylase subunit